MRNDQVSGVFGGSPPKDTAPLSTTNDCFIGWRRRHYFTPSRRTQRPGCSREFRISVDFPYFVIHFRFPPSLPVFCYGVYHTAFVLCKASVSAKFACCVAVGIWVGAVGGAEGLPSGKPFRCRRSAVEPAPSATRATVSPNTNSHLTCVLKCK